MKNKSENVVKKYINLVINSELFIILIGIILFFKMFLFYKLTIYYYDQNDFNIITKTFIYSMFIVTFLFLFPNRIRFVVGTILNLLFSTLMFADNLYYNYSTSLISVSQISNLQYSEQIGAAVKDLLSVWQLLYFVDIIVMLILLITKFVKLKKIKEKKYKPAIVYFIIMTIIYSSTIPNYVAEAEGCRYNKKMQLEKGTLYTFHYLDVKSNLNLKKTAKYTSKEEVMQAYNDLKNSYNDNYQDDIYNFSNIAQGKNVILLQLESYQGFLINKTINGKEITPNINKFISENIQINNMMIQSYSTTADSEHSAQTSMYPLENGMAFAQYSSNSYDDIFGLYKDEGYYTMYMHGNEGSFWNRNNVYKLLDIDELDFINNFDPDSERINNWISDEALYTQSVQKMKTAKQNYGKFFSNIVSASCHTGFDLPGLDDKYSKVSIDVGEYKGTYFGQYLEAANYADYAFGIFIDELKANDLYDDTVIFIFGDHYGMQMYNEEMLNFIKKQDHKLNNVDAEINYINVVCGIKIPGVNHLVIDKTVSKLDIKPTLASICGLEDKVSLGTNIFGAKDFACLNNGVIVTNDLYYNGEWYKRSDGSKINTNELDGITRGKINYYINSMEQELTISNSIVLNNLLK